MPRFSAVRISRVLSIWIERDESASLVGVDEISFQPTPKQVLRSSKLLLQTLGFVVAHQGVDQRTELSFHDVRQLVESQADAVIRHAVLRKIVGADFFGAVAGSDLAAALRANGGLLLLEFLFVEASTQNAHSLRAILDLRFFVLLRNNQATGNVCDTHRGISGVHGLPAGAGRTKGIDPQILRFDFDIDVVRFGEDSYSRSRSVNAALRFRSGHALHAMNPAFVFQLGIDFVSLNR